MKFSLAIAATFLLISCSVPERDSPYDPKSFNYAPGKGNDISGYKTIQIGTQVWMAENLDYVVSGGKCYDNDPANCAKYGRLYDWATAMALPSNCDSSVCSRQINAKHRGICPSGWHIPSDEDWDILMDYVGDEYTAGTKLKARSGWNGGGSGTDDYGFTALPGGNGGSDGNFYNVGDFGFWWSADESDAYNAYSRGMNYDYEYIGWYDLSKSNLRSLRCIRDVLVILSSSSVVPSSSSVVPIVSSSSSFVSSSSSTPLPSSSSVVPIVSSSSSFVSSSSSTPLPSSSSIVPIVSSSSSFVPSSSSIALPSSNSVVPSSSSIALPSSSSVVPSSSSIALPSSSSSFVPSSSSSSSSSSIALPSSSSLVPSSSSVPTQSGIIDGTSVPYEGSTYETVVIGTQTWFKRNLNYAVAGSKCGNGGNGGNLSDVNTSRCDTYGRLYDWATAMALDTSCNSSSCASQIGANHQGICPIGWHIPSNADWNVLVNYAGGYSTAGTKLKATNGWSSNVNGQDTYGFTALPGGYGASGLFVYVGDMGIWWSAREDNANRAYDGYIYLNGASYDTGYKYNLLSVRCLKD